MTDDAFRVTYECQNCGNEWDDTYEQNVRVKTYELDNGQPYVRVNNHDEFSTSYKIVCDVCRLTVVTVTDRSPTDTSTAATET